MIQLDRHPAKLIAFTPNTEKHGKEDVPCSYLKWEINISNHFLESIGTGLLAAIYKPTEGREQLPLSENDNFPTLRFPRIGAFKWKYKGIGYKIEIREETLFKKKPIELLGNIDNITITPKEGGSLVLEFRTPCHPSPEDVAKIYQLQKKEISISLLPASGSYEAPMDDEEVKEEMPENAEMDV